MYERFTDRARKVMQLANHESQRFNHEYIGTEHMLLGLVKEGSGVGANVLKNLDVDLHKIRAEVEKIVQSGPDMVTMGKLPTTPRAKKVIEYAVEEARNLGHNYVGTEHLLLGLVREVEGIASQVLMNLGLRLADVRQEVLNLLGHNMDREDSGAEAKAQPRPRKKDGPRQEGFPKLISEALLELDAQVKQLNQEKADAVAQQDFAKAAHLRDEAEKLLRQCSDLAQAWQGKQTKTVYEYDLYLPLQRADGTPLGDDWPIKVRDRLMAQFGGVLEFRNFMEGALRLGSVRLEKEIVIYRMLSRESARSTVFFTQLKEELKADLRCEDVLILVQKAHIL